MDFTNSEKGKYLAKSEKNREEAVEMIKQIRTNIFLTGRVVNGKVELDKSCLERIAKEFPGAERAFIAVNAPFDPVTQLIS